MEYRIETKQSFTIVGISRRFRMEDCYQQIPVFWKEVLGQGDRPAGIVGMFGVTYDTTDTDFAYMIGDLYEPWREYPLAYPSITYEKGTWAVFPVHGKLPESLQSVNSAIWQSWIPEHQKSFRFRTSGCVEMYAPLPKKPEETYAEIWLPLDRTGSGAS